MSDAGHANQIDREFERHIADYILETGDQNWTLPRVAAWIDANGRCPESRERRIKSLIRRLRRVAGRAGFVDPDTGRWIRKYYPYQLGDQQPTLWGEGESLDVEKFRSATEIARNNITSRVFQWVDNVDYYNRKNNKSGDPVLFDPDFTKEVAEREQPGLYDDNPPDEESPEEPKG